MTDRPPVLVLGNDADPAAAKTSRHLGRALEKLGYAAVVRDTRLNRWGAKLVEGQSPERRQAFETAVVAKWERFLSDYGIERVISLDLHWLFSSRLFLENSQIKSIDSFWVDDARSHLLAASTFDLAPWKPLDFLIHPKITHYCGRNQGEELRQLGVSRVKFSLPAAPAEMLRADDPCRVKDRLGFIGTPGIVTPPTVAALAAINRGEDLPALRELARTEILEHLPIGEPGQAWIKEQPGILDLLADAMAAKVLEPNEAAIFLLQRAGQNYPDAYNFLNRVGSILDAALLVKLVRRYDRPALVHRLWKRGWLEVHGAPEQWKLYGVEAQPDVPFPQLATVYRRYSALLHAPNGARDAATDEEIFEMAACARASLNLDSLDVAACFSDEEIFCADSIAAFEKQAADILRDPASAFAKGERARQRVAREHTWDHRLAGAWA